MPKSDDKGSSRKRRKVRNYENDKPTDKAISKGKNNNHWKTRPQDEIELSKQIAAKRRTKKASPYRSRAKKNHQPKLCGNGKPMPSLAELERMYDSDGDDVPEGAANPASTVINTLSIAELDKRNENIVNVQDITGNPIPTSPKTCSTPTNESSSSIIESIPLSPRTLNQIVSKAKALLEELRDKQDRTPQPHVIPPKKRQKPDLPYIVGCTERTKVEFRPKTSFLVGNTTYGVVKDAPSDEEICPKKRRGGPKLDISKSTFNKKTDENVPIIKEKDNVGNVEIEIPGSPDSNKTIDYEFNHKSPSKIIRPFSPLPSTSKDSETILKNDQKFNESLLNQTIIINDSLECQTLNEDSQNHNEMIETPCEIIDLLDTTFNQNVTKSAPITIYDNDDCHVIESVEDVKITKPATNSNNVKSKDDTILNQNRTSYEHNVSNDKNDCQVIEPVEDVKITKPATNSNNVKSKRDTILNQNISINGRNVYDEDDCQVIEPVHVNKTVKPEIKIINVKSEYDTIDLTSFDNNNFMMSDDEDINVDDVLANNITFLEGIKRDNVTEVVTIVEPINVAKTQSTSNSQTNIKLSNNDNEELPCVNIRNASQLGRDSTPIQTTVQANPTRNEDNFDILNVSEEIVINDDDNILQKAIYESITTAAHSSNQRPHNKATAHSSNTVNSFRNQRPHDMATAHSSNSINRPRPHNKNIRLNNRNYIITDTIIVPAHENPSVPQKSQNASTHNVHAPIPQTSQSALAQNAHAPTPGTSIQSSVSRSFGDCPICFDSLSSNSVAATLCGHIFCMNCIKQTILISGKKCPKCRKKLKGIGYHQLFL